MKCLYYFNSLGGFNMNTWKIWDEFMKHFGANKFELLAEKMFQMNNVNQLNLEQVPLILHEI